MTTETPSDSEYAAKRWSYDDAVQRADHGAAVRANTILHPSWTDAQHSDAVARDIREASRERPAIAG